MYWTNNKAKYETHHLINALIKFPVDKAMPIVLMVNLG